MGRPRRRCWDVPCLAVLAGMVPPARGTLTEAELIRNYNHVNRVYGLEAPEMEPNGMLGENPNLGLAAWGWYTPTVTLTEQEGVVTGFAVAWKNVPTWNTYHTPSMAAPAALGGALLAERADLGPVSYQTAIINYIKALADLTLADAMAGKNRHGGGARTYDRGKCDRRRPGGRRCGRKLLRVRGGGDLSGGRHPAGGVELERKWSGYDIKL